MQEGSKTYGKIDSHSSTKNVRLNSHIFWCASCRVPLVQGDDELKICPLCGGETTYLASDVRPVFPEEKVLFALLFEKPCDEFLEKSVWVANSRYYVNGKSYSLSTQKLRNADAEKIFQKISENKNLVERGGEAYTFFEQNIACFVKANQNHLNFIKDEAADFVCQQLFKSSLKKVIF